jgi:hypothetical protein
MLSLNNDFLGYHPTEHTVKFSSSDSEGLYNKNLKSKSIDWYYRTNVLSYLRNSNGHRCREILDINLDNYILFVGCSVTEGIGLELEKTYPYLISKSLGCDYYNLGVGGTGIDVLMHNLITWFSTVKQKPKLVILQWPGHVRFISNYTAKHSDGRPEINEYMSYGAWSTEEGVDKFLIAGHDIGFFDTRRTMTHNLIKNVITCPIIEVAYKNAKFHEDIIVLDRIKTDYARDLLHSGILSNIKYASIITDIIKDKYIHDNNN